jgi:hypothetical protein
MNRTAENIGVALFALVALFCAFLFVAVMVDGQAHMAEVDARMSANRAAAYVASYADFQAESRRLEMQSR